MAAILADSGLSCWLLATSRQLTDNFNRPGWNAMLCLNQPSRLMAGSAMENAVNAKERLL